jgi:hypothetical protein
MTERRDDLSTADLATPQPTDPARSDRAEEVELGRQQHLADDHGRENLRQADLERGPAVLGDRPADVEPGRGPVRDVEPGRGPVREDHDRSTEPGLDQDPAATPVAAAAPRATSDSGPADTSSAGPLLASEDAEGFRARWTDVQTGFVDAPRQAVEQADGLVAELMQHLARTFADERGRLESQWDRGDDVPTDDLRTAFQRYRSFFERLLAT